jgi:uncharacterized protein
MGESERIRIGIVYALPHQQAVLSIVVPRGSSVHDVIAASGLKEKFPEIGTAPSCAIFGQVVEGTRIVNEGDRVEILRPLLMDPKEARRKAAASTRTKNR